MLEWIFGKNALRGPPGPPGPQGPMGEAGISDVPNVEARLEALEHNVREAYMAGVEHSDRFMALNEAVSKLTKRVFDLETGGGKTK